METARNFYNYCKAYLQFKHNMNERKATFVLLDPLFGQEIDHAKQKWSWKDLGGEIDPDTFLSPPVFEAQEMKRINEVIDKYAYDFPKRENYIREYLNSIGHPYGSIDLE